MTPRAFLGQVVRPNFTEFHADERSIRRAWNAALTLDALAAHIFVWCLTNAPAEVSGISEETYYKDYLAAGHEEFRILREIAKAQRQIEIQGDDTKPRHLGGRLQVVIDIDTKGARPAEDILDSALWFLEAEMTRLNI